MILNWREMKSGQRGWEGAHETEEYPFTEQGKSFSFQKEHSLVWSNSPIYKTALNFYNNLQKSIPMPQSAGSNAGFITGCPWINKI